MSRKVGRCIGWLLGTLIILVPVLLLLLIVFMFIMWLLVKAGAIIQKS